MSSAVILLVAVAHAAAATTPRAAHALAWGPLAVSSRRSLLVSAPFAASALIAGSRASRADSGTTVYTDTASGFSFAYPSDWVLSKKTLDRAQLPLVIVNQPSSPSTNAFLAVNSIRGDYATLGSFGSPLDVLANLVPPAGTAGVSSEVFKTASRGNYYDFDYAISVDGSPTRHLRTVFAIAHSPSGSDFLVTLTAQAEEANYEQAKGAIDALMASAKL